MPLFRDCSAAACEWMLRRSVPLGRVGEKKFHKASIPLGRRYQKRTPFTDAVKLLVSSGVGGDGAVMLHHEPNQEYGGPGGGNGGRGGSVLLKCTRRYADLAHLAAFGSFVRADSGLNGGAAKRQGKTGEDLVLEVPPGTTVVDVDTGDVCFDLDTEGTEVQLLEGGKGGKGNHAFRSAVQQLPLNATRGMPGNTMLALFELKAIADVGLVGLPNAGKSSLLAAVSTCAPKVAAYPFTTLHPQIGKLQDLAGNTCEVADLPGLLEGAYENRGLGHRFLRHVERSRMLAFVVDMHAPYAPLPTDTSAAGRARDASAAARRRPWDVVRMLRDELEYFQPGLAARATVVFANKIDTGRTAAGRCVHEEFDELRTQLAPEGLTCFPVSAQVGLAEGPGAASGLDTAVAHVCRAVFDMRRAAAKALAEEKAATRAELRRQPEQRHVLGALHAAGVDAALRGLGDTRAVLGLHLPVQLLQPLQHGAVLALLLEEGDHVLGLEALLDHPTGEQRLTGCVQIRQLGQLEV